MHIRTCVFTHHSPAAEDQQKAALSIVWPQEESFDLRRSKTDTQNDQPHRYLPTPFLTFGNTSP